LVKADACRHGGVDEGIERIKPDGAEHFIALCVHGSKVTAQEINTGRHGKKRMVEREKAH
jgi:hypothetical protein